MPLVAHASEGVRTQRSFDGFAAPGLFAAHVVHLHAVTARQRDQNELVVRRSVHVSRHRTCGCAPLDGLAGQVNRHQLIAVLHG